MMGRWVKICHDFRSDETVQLRRTIGISAIPGETPGEKTGLSACNVIAVTREMLDTVVSITTQRRGRSKLCRKLWKI